jgi:hypothetical protein
MEDSIVQAVVKSFLERSALGQKKYGVTLDRTDLKPLDWIQHAQEELMDGILYLERLKKDFSSTSEQGARGTQASPSSRPEDCQAAASPPHPSPE